MHKGSWRRGAARSLIVLALIPALTVWSAKIAAADVDTVSGRAFGEQVTGGGLVLSGPVPIVTLPPTGGNLTDTLASVNVPPGCQLAPATCLLQSGTLTVHTEGTTGPSGFASSSADVENLSLGGGQITVQLVHSECNAVGNQPDATSGSTRIVGGSGGGQSFPENPPPNTTIDLQQLGTVILNEQIETGAPGEMSQAITVNAIHATLFPGTAAEIDVIISQSHCDVNGPNVGIPIGAIGGVLLAGVLGVLFLGWQFRNGRQRRLRRETA